jgi:hypothetical protein
MKERRRGLTAVGAAAARLTKPIFAKRGLADGAIVREWAAIVGAKLAAESAPEKIAYAGDQGTEGTLHLRIANGGLAVELQHLEPLLIERINGYFGYCAVARVRLVQGPLPTPPTRRCGASRPLSGVEEDALARCLAGIADATLRARLDALGRAIMGRTGTLSEPPDRA